MNSSAAILIHHNDDNDNRSPLAEASIPLSASAAPSASSLMDVIIDTTSPLSAPPDHQKGTRANAAVTAADHDHDTDDIKRNRRSQQGSGSPRSEAAHRYIRERERAIAHRLRVHADGAGGSGNDIGMGGNNRILTPQEIKDVVDTPALIEAAPPRCWVIILGIVAALISCSGLIAMVASPSSRLATSGTWLVIFGVILGCAFALLLVIPVSRNELHNGRAPDGYRLQLDVIQSARQSAVNAATAQRNNRAQLAARRAAQTSTLLASSTPSVDNDASL